jgi:TRAP-type uncharacterized transport system substrate-binding protein
LGLLTIALATLYALRPGRERPVVLTLTAGSREGTRARLAEAMVGPAKARGVILRLVETRGSEEALERVDAGGCDLALVQGGLTPRRMAAVRQVAALHAEPLHLLVKPGVGPDVAGRLSTLAGRRINVGEPGSGTYRLATAVLAFAGLGPGRYVAESRGYAGLMAEDDPAALPDAVFTVSTLPSRLARHLVARHGYRLVALPFAEAFALSTLDEDGSFAPGGPADEVRREHVYDTVIPAFTYGVEPGVPPGPTHTLGTRLVLVAREGVPAEAVGRLLDVLFASRFAEVVSPPLRPELLNLPPELEPHPGTTAYQHRAQPLSTGDFIDLAEKWFSMAGVTAGGAVCLWQWLRRRARRRQDRGFESYILKVADVERRAADQELSAGLDLPALLGLRRELARLKQEALEKFAAGDLEGEELMSGFLAHAGDTRTYLTRLILHQRDNLEEAARVQGRAPEALWDETVNGAVDSRGDPVGVTEAVRPQEALGGRPSGV